LHDPKYWVGGLRLELLVPGSLRYDCINIIKRYFGVTSLKTCVSVWKRDCKLRRFFYAQTFVFIIWQV